MATLDELATLYGDGDLLNKVSAAIVISAYNLLQGTPTAADRAYAAKVFSSPKGEAQRVLKYVLAANSAATISAIQSATDVAIQTEVDAAVVILVQADAGA